MFETMRAYAAHVFTATGAVFSMLAMLAAVDERWAAMFVWLMVAFIVDGVDGSLARRYDVTVKAPIIDGALLDLVIDYLSYVFVPAFALHRAGLLPGTSGTVALLVIAFASAIYFADTRMKTADKSFSGFPACWNMVAIVVFATQPQLWRILAVVIVLTIAMFVPVKFIHPVRTRRWRAVSLPVAIAWTALAGFAAWSDFTQATWVTQTLLVASFYLLGAGAVQQVLDRRATHRTRHREDATSGAPA
jgi:phosphatidylcholine synthase